MQKIQLITFLVPLHRKVGGMGKFAFLKLLFCLWGC